MKKIVIHGGGYVGLTGAVHFALADFQVIIYDPDAEVVDSINNGEPRAKEYLSYINADVKILVQNGMLTATRDYESIKHELIHFLAVPTESGDQPNMSIVKDVISNLHDSIPAGGLIIVESTLKPGTIDSILLPRVHQKKIHLAVCPRLDWFSDQLKNLSTLPRIIGGVTEEATQEAYKVLKNVCVDCRLTNHAVAEFAKAGQNALYFVQIMAAHQMAEHYQGQVDMNEVLKFIGFHWRLPDLFLGPGTSGRCVAMGAKYLTDNTFDNMMTKALSYDNTWREIIGDRLTRGLPFVSDEKKVLIMGVAYRPNFSDFGYSAGLDIYKYLTSYAWNCYINDPIVNKNTLMKLGQVGYLEPDKDAILLATAHREYANLPECANLFRRGQFVLDATGLWGMYRNRFASYGVTYVRVGEKGWLN